MNEKDIKVIKKMAKSMHKAFCKAFHYDKKSKDRKKGKDVVSDILDPNYQAEANPADVPARRTGVMYKSEDLSKKIAEVVVKKYIEHKKGNL
jgi:hypothetical protein